MNARSDLGARNPFHAFLLFIRTSRGQEISDKCLSLDAVTARLKGTKTDTKISCSLQLY